MDVKPTIDLSRHHFMHTYKDLCVFGTWIHNNDQEDYEPCLAIVPRYRHPKTCTPAVVALSSAFKYNTASYARECALRIQAFNIGLGFSDDLANAYKLKDAIEMYLGDLLKMPENPTTSIVVADAVVTIGGKSRTVELLEHQSTPQI